MKLKKNQVTHFSEWKRYESILKVTLLLLGINLVQACQNERIENTVQEHPNITKLKSQSSEFTPEIIQLKGVSGCRI